MRVAREGIGERSEEKDERKKRKRKQETIN